MNASTRTISKTAAASPQGKAADLAGRPQKAAGFFTPLSLASILVLAALALFAFWLSRATADQPQPQVEDQYPDTPDCEMYRGLPDEYLDCVYPRPS